LGSIAARGLGSAAVGDERRRLYGKVRGAVALATLVGSAACGDTMPRAQGAFCPPECPPASGAQAVPGAFAAPALAAAASLAPLDPNAWDPASVRLVLEDPRLAIAAALVQREQYAKAADALEAALAAPPVEPLERAAWLYQLGHLRALGGNPGAAAKAYQASAALGGPLADFAHLEAAQWLEGAGAHDEALAEAKRAGDDPAIASALDLVIADASSAKGDAEALASHLRSYLARDKHPPHWAETSLRLAEALLAKPSEAHAEEAVRLARRVIDESHGGAGAGAAKDVEKRALDSMPFDKRKRFEHPSSEESLARAKSLVGSAQYKEAIAAATKLLKLPAAKKAGELGCEAAMVKGDALKGLRKKPEAADAYGAAAELCAGRDRAADALFNAGRSLAQAGRGVEAMRRYAELEREFPAHRLADDARLKGALAALDANDEPRFEDMLAKMADDYPKGDVTVDGLVALALHFAEKGAWDKAIAPLERALAIAPRERAYYAAGRVPYYLARAHLATGQVEKGEAELARVIAQEPLSFYMALAYARLAERNHAAADKAVADAIAKEPRAPFTIAKGAWLDDSIFVRGMALAREGDIKASAELARLGLHTRTAPREVAWASVFLLSKAGFTTMSHGLLRTANQGNTPRAGELVEWLDHWPVGAWEAPWQLAFPRPFEAVVAPAAQREHLPEAWAHAIMREESAFDARVASPAKAYGLMQLIVPTAKRMGGPLGLNPDEEALKHPDVNVPIGCRYLAFLRGMFPDDPLLAIPGYNAGGNAPKKWLAERGAMDFDLWVERIPYEETRNYTKRVITSLAAYEFLYAKDKPSEALHMPLAASPAMRAGRVAQGATPSDEGTGGVIEP
jgi:soluble lytic murein transglycosylase